jgi:GxxExxY protein
MQYPEDKYPLQKESSEIIGKKFVIEYRDTILSHHFFADFVVYDQIILEAKAQKGIVEEHYAWVINYLGISKCPLGLIVNFGEKSLITKRIIG